MTRKGQSSTQQSSMLHRLSDSNLTLADAGADIRGRRVRDVAGDEIGKVDDLLIDDGERKVRFLEVASGGVLGIGETKVLLPVEAVTSVGAEEVRINQSREKVSGAPRYDPELTEASHLGDIYGYYGYTTPFWGLGYNYPRYPYL